jgi:hypothetical protein
LDTLLGLQRLWQDRLMRFVDEHPGAHVIRYESLIAGDLTALEGFLGISLERDTEVGSTHARVTRTRGAGSWQVGNGVRLWGLGLGVSCGDLLGSNLVGSRGYLLLRDRKGSTKESGFGAQSFLCSTRGSVRQTKCLPLESSFA